ncbi:MAG: DUF948 domain-containing protein [Ruminococcaceae bacterium]|nr:DUF948 domain-containing protein [Oscillospiraceae bacterium]
MPKNKNAVKEPRAQKKDGFFKKTCKTLADASLGTEYKTVAAEGKQRFPVMMIIAAVVTTALFMLIIFSFMQISQIRSDMAKMEATIRSLEKEERKLSMELEGRYSSKIESLAADMGLSGESRVTYYLDDGSSAEIMEAVDPAEEGKNSNTLMSAVSKSFRKFIEFME